jgi:purine-binding chemotaxis protein CheW
MDLEDKRAKRARVLAERAQLLARRSGEEKDLGDQLEVVFCTVGSEVFAIPVEHLREIVLLPSITKVPSCPSWILGIAHIRGSLLSVIDLGQVCRAKGESHPEHVAVIHTPHGPLGLTVDSVLSSKMIALSKLTVPDDRSDRRASLGVTPDLAVLLDIHSLVSLPELVVE